MTITALVFDFETTGLTLHPRADLSVQPRAIEFGGVLLADGVAIEEVSLLFNPQQPISPEITKITGLTDEALRDQPTFERSLPVLRALFERAEVMIAHNLPFDRAVLTYELSRAGAKDFPWPRPLCTAQLYQDAWGRRPRLIELYKEVLGRPLSQTHRALDDCKALAEIVCRERLWELA